MQPFVTILEFKLLGNVVSAGVKVMVLAVIVGVGSDYVTQVTAALQGHVPDIAGR